MGDNYYFSANRTPEQVKEIIATKNIYTDGDVPFKLQAGNLSISVDICSDNKSDVWLEYYYRKVVDDESCWYGISDDVNLDVPDIEIEMFRVLDKLAEEKGLSFFIQNNEYNADNNGNECNEDLEL